MIAIKSKPAKRELLLGASTGWLYSNGINSIVQHSTLLRKVAANTVEIGLSSWDKGAITSLVQRGEEIFSPNWFMYRSVHLPGTNTPNELLEHIEDARAIVRGCNAQTAVIHPILANGKYPVTAINALMKRGVPIAIENMDATKNSGYDPSELETIIQETGCKFVLDVQHAYEHDLNGEYGKRLFQTLKNSLVHLHVSGETATSNHARVCVADNRNEILESVRWILERKNVPIILEGEYGDAGELQEEIRFLRRELTRTKV